MGVPPLEPPSPQNLCLNRDLALCLSAFRLAKHKPSEGVLAMVLRKVSTSFEDFNERDVVQILYSLAKMNVQIDESSREVEKGPIGWLCGVSSSQIYKGDCRERVEEEPCGEWNQFTLLQSSIPRCFFGHGSICYVAIQPDPVTGGVCKDGVCTPFNSTNADIISKDAMQYQNGLLAQGRCVACV